MLKKFLIVVTIITTVIIISAVLVLSACGGKPAATTTPSTTSKAATTPSPTQASKPTTVTTPAPDTSALRAKGEEIFQKTAGGVGCKTCHGVDGKGGNLGPDIRDKTIDDIKRALATSETMSFIKLSGTDIEAVATYVKSLMSQP